MNFQRSDYDANRYKVFSDKGDFLGFVRRCEGWTVRGRPVTWRAYRGTSYAGTAKTRKAAAELLQPR